MFEVVEIEGFRCLRKVRLELEPFTVFVGPNASWKTAIADALTGNGVGAKDRWRKSRKPTQMSFSAEMTNGQQRSGANPHDLGERRQKHVLEPKWLRSRETANEVWALDGIGRSLANLFDTLSREDQERFVGVFPRLVPAYADLKTRSHQGKTRLQFQDRWDHDVWYEPEEVSDGSVLAAGLVALTFQRNPPDLVVIEDPDNGLHPYLQREVVGLLRKLSRGEIGDKSVQVVCTTHSKAFLDHLEPEEVRFLSRDPKTGEPLVERAPTDNPKWQQVYDRYQNSLGNLWLTGAVGGVPGNRAVTSWVVVHAEGPGELGSPPSWLQPRQPLSDAEWRGAAHVLVARILEAD